MTESAPFAVTPGGARVVCGDGPELLVYGEDGRPAWKAFGDGLLLAVGGDAEIVTGDADGRVTWYGALDGRVVERHDVGPARAWALSARRAVALGPRGGVLIERGGATRRFSGAYAAAAFGADGRLLGLGGDDGVFRAVDAGAEPGGGVALGSPIAGVAWSPSGCWLVAAGASLFTIASDASAVLARHDAPAPLAHPAVSADGLFAAAAQGDDAVLFDLATLHPLGRVAFRRRIGGIAFGRPGALWVGHDDGDATLVEITGGGAGRTEPHPGRGRNTWSLDAQLDHAAVRGVWARGQAGGTPLATYTGAKPSSGRPRWLGCLLASLGCLGLLFGCLGLGLVAWLLQQARF